MAKMPKKPAAGKCHITLQHQAPQYLIPSADVMQGDDPSQAACRKSGMHSIKAAAEVIKLHMGYIESLGWLVPCFGGKGHNRWS